MTANQRGSLLIEIARIVSDTDLTMDNIAIRWSTDEDCRTAEVMTQPFDWEGRDPITVASRWTDLEGDGHDFHLFIASDGEVLASYEIQ